MNSSLVPKGFEITAHPIFANYKPPPPPSSSQKTSSSPSTTPPPKPNPKTKKRKLEEDIDIEHCTICPICLENAVNPVTMISCHHFFCFVCIDNWYKIKQNCPLCKEHHTSFIKSKFIDNFDEMEVWRYNTSKGKKIKASDPAVFEAIQLHKQRFQTQKQSVSKQDIS